MGIVLKYLFTGLVVSMFYFSFGFTFLPAAVNTKLLLSIVGFGMSCYHAVQNGAMKIDRALIGAAAFAVLFSMVCFIAVDFNYTNDFSYATYIVSFLVWIFSAYAVCVTIRWVHGRVNLSLLTYYLIAVCFLQCLLALAINTMPEFQFFVNRYIEQGQEFLLEVDRLYGIGASLDNAGVRFSIVLILIAAVLSKERELRNSTGRLSLILLAFFTIIVIGNMISRTTSVGAGMALAYLVWSSGLAKLVVGRDFFKFHLLFGCMLILAIMITAYFFKTDPMFRAQIRFAFEGFFNWVEKGVWRTNSTDKLNRNMWVWPSDTRTWLTGTGLFDNWIYGTDIGYCRFILYCGLPGFMIFALFFVYNAVVFGRGYRQYRVVFYMLLVLTFIVWIKVSTDIFLIYALFYSIDMFNRHHQFTHQDEDRLLHSRYV